MFNRITRRTDDKSRGAAVSLQKLNRHYAAQECPSLRSG